MELLLQFEMGFIIAIATIFTSLWQFAQTDRAAKRYKKCSIIIGILLLLLVGCWISFLQSHLDIVLYQSHKIIHYLVLLTMQSVVLCAYLFLLVRADNKSTRTLSK
jgi:ATP/ADP translocase